MVNTYLVSNTWKKKRFCKGFGEGTGGEGGCQPSPPDYQFKNASLPAFAVFADPRQQADNITYRYDAGTKNSVCIKDVRRQHFTSNP